MFNLKPWSPDLDLTEFYDTARKKGFVNNSSQKLLVDCFDREREKQVWILYFNEKAIGSVAAHSFDDVMGENTYRIAARTCVFTDQISDAYRTYGSALRTKSVITENQNPTAQFLIPQCIEWAPAGSRLFITSNESDVGTQKRVHNIFCPLMEKYGMMKRIDDNVLYRGIKQSVWELFPDRFYEQLNKYPRWT